MSMAKAEQKTKEKYTCIDCKTDYEGQGECPQCGNKEGNIKLAADGIDRGLHSMSYLLKTNGLKPTSSFEEDDLDVIQRQQAKMQIDEMRNNLRESYLLKSKIKSLEDNMELEKKKIEAKRITEMSKDYMEGKSTTPPQQSITQDTQQIQQMPLMSQLSPQAVFMQQLMKMDSKKRAEFIEQLSDADPGALANLSAMFPQPQPVQPQYPQQQPNIYGQYPMYPPWMNQTPTQPEPKTDPIALVTAIFELSRKMAPPKDDSMKDMLKEFMEIIKKDRETPRQSQNQELSPLIDKINRLEQRLVDAPPKKTIGDSISEINQLINGLSEIGLVQKPGLQNQSVDDQLKLKEFDFKKDKSEKELEIERERIEADKAKSSFQQQMVSTLIQRGLQKTIAAKEEVKATTVPQRVSKINSEPRKQQPAEVVSEVETDGGTIRETRRPVADIRET